jgi:hypothetical protein
MKHAKIWALALIVCTLSSSFLVIPAGGQDPALQEQYEQAMHLAREGDTERAYSLAEKLALRNPLFYPGRLLRIALAARLKKSGPEDPQNLLRVLKGDAPLGSNPERDLQELLNRFSNPAAPGPKPPVAVSPYVKRKHALVIGIGNFKDPKINGLKYTTNDARAFAEALRARCLFDSIETLIDETATTYNIKTRMDELAKQSTREDLVVVFIAGHGSPESLDSGGINYIITYDTEVDNLYATAYAMSDLLNDIERRISAERVVAFIDTCYSGATFKQRPKVWVSSSRDFGLPAGLRMDPIKERLVRANQGVRVETASASAGSNTGRKKQGVGRVIIASSRQDQKSWESKSIQHGYFTHFLLEAITNPGIISVQDLYKYLSEEVPKTVQLEVKAQQNPTMVTSIDGPAEIYLKEQP